MNRSTSNFGKRRVPAERRSERPSCCSASPPSQRSPSRHCSSSALEKLHAYLRARLAGRVNVEVAFRTPQDVLVEALPLFEQTRERSIADLLRTIEEAPRERVARGAPSVFDALFERRVDELVVRGDYAAPGVRCPECGWLSMDDAATCPQDGVSTEQSPDVIDDAIDLAFLGAARVIVTDPDGDAQPDQPIVALLRY
jgi:peptide subunit release factor 1 (eRF1)